MIKFSTPQSCFPQPFADRDSLFEEFDDTIICVPGFWAWSLGFIRRYFFLQERERPSASHNSLLDGC